MKLATVRRTTVDFEGQKLEIKHLTTREYRTFAATEDKDQALKFLVQVSLGISDEDYDNIPMSVLAKLPMLIMQANGLDPQSEEAAGN